MNIIFESETSPKNVIDNIQEKLSGRNLGKIVSLDLAPNSSLTVTIKKAGKSTLEFDIDGAKSGVVWSLRKEKIALAHRAFKSEVLEKIRGIVEQAGGELVR